MRLKLGIAALAFAATTAAYAATLPEGCGNDAIQYKAKAEKGGSIPAPEAGKAQLVFIQTHEGDGEGMPLSRFAVDGEWVGAAKGRSYVVVSIAPGEHKLCASRQSSIRMEKENAGADHVNAEAGKTYYFQFTIKTSEVDPAKQANGGTNQMLNNTPDMTAKRHETIDTAEFTSVTEQGADEAIKHAQHSVASAK
jgi:Protein of unknown function (DUF2846)